MGLLLYLWIAENALRDGNWWIFPGKYVKKVVQLVLNRISVLQSWLDHYRQWKEGCYSTFQSKLNKSKCSCKNI